MIDKKSITNSIILVIKFISKPIEGYTKYQNSSMFNYYTNFLDFFFTKIFDDYNIEIHIEKGTLKKWGIQDYTIKLIKMFLSNLEKFYKKHEESDDYTLLRDNYWEKFSKEAKKCVKLLERDLENMND